MSLGINLTKGTFTFVAGKVAKTGDMKIDTPVATVVIGGTTPHEISDDGSVKFSTLIEKGKSKLLRSRDIRRTAARTKARFQIKSKRLSRLLAFSVQAACQRTRSARATLNQQEPSDRHSQSSKPQA